MKTYYSDYLIDMAEPNLVHDQFGQKHPIPENGGKTIEFRKYEPLEKKTSPIDEVNSYGKGEGKTPEGQSLTMSTVTATVKQYGGYVELSDMLLLTAIDNNLVQATKLLGGQAGRTLDTITRDEINAGKTIQYGECRVTSRKDLKGGAESGNDYLTVNAVRMAVRTLKRNNAPKINGDYVAIIHPDCTYDLMSDPNWKYPHQYVDTKEIYEGEIGKIEGVRFVETSEAMIFPKGGNNNTTRDVYSTLVIGDGAYGVTDIRGGGLQHIVKQLGSAGTADPLNQRATVGWKATKACARLVEAYMVRIETTASAEYSA
jgi:N4-gp56 family major capsid protein